MRTAIVLILFYICAYGQTPGSCVCAGAIQAYPAGSEPACNAANRSSVIISLGESGQPDLFKVCVRDGLSRFLWTSPAQQNANTFTGIRTVGGCPIFPDNNVWNSKAASLPRDSASNAIIGTYASFKLGIDPNMTINLADSSTPALPVTFASTESDPGLYPIAGSMQVEGYAFNQVLFVAGGPYKSDAHLLVVRTDTCKLYEVYALSSAAAPYTAASGAVFDLTGNELRQEGWTSADAAGLPIWPGILTYDEVYGPTEIQHMVRFTVDRTRNSYVWPARHFASRSANVAFPPMGSRWRLKADFDDNTCRANDHAGEAYPAEFQKLIRAFKQYGMILADNGKAILITADADPRWGDPNSPSSALYSINGWAHCIVGSDFEVVNSAPLMTNGNSGAVQR